MKQIRAELSAVFFAVLFLFMAAGRAEAAPTDLESYLRLLRKVDPYAVITSGFWDWRTVSVYRSRAGYHLGYDIGMPRGTAVPAGWDGRVITVASWGMGEWGVTILTERGYCITYGHVTPFVSEGMQIKAGMAVGSVSVHHVDIKITDPQGNYIDFGKTAGLLPVSPGAEYLIGKQQSLISQIDRAALIKARQRELSLLEGSVGLLEEYFRAEQELLSALKKERTRMEKLYGEELISRNDWEGCCKSVNRQEDKVHDLKTRLLTQRDKIALLKKELALYGAKPLEKPKTAKKEGEGNKALEDAKKKSETYERLYREGAVSRSERDEAVDAYKRLRLKIMLEEAEKEK